MHKLVTAVSAAALLASALGASAQAQEIHSNHWVYSMPQGMPASNDLIIRNSYALSSNDTTKFADWVAYRLTPGDVYGTLDLDRNWRPDPSLDDDETLEPRPDDYKGAFSEPLKYERGHLAPLASFKGSRHASEVNYYSNITPQAKALNGGPWKRLETRVREYVLQGNVVWVTTGPLFEENIGTLPNEDEDGQVLIPSSFWKIVFDGDRVAGFIMHQRSGSGDSLSSKVKTVEEIEERSGLSFDHGPDEAALEVSEDASWLID